LWARQCLARLFRFVHRPLATSIMERRAWLQQVRRDRPTLSGGDSRYSADGSFREAVRSEEQLVLVRLVPFSNDEGHRRDVRVLLFVPRYSSIERSPLCGEREQQFRGRREQISVLKTVTVES